MRIKAAVLFVGLAAWAGGAQANLGDTLSQAKAHGRAYETHFGAVAPLFQTDAKGRVVWECWAAPPDLWSRDKALALVRKLIPPEMASKSPEEQGVDGGAERYVFPDGTVAVLHGFQGKVLDVEVHTASYAGNHC